MQNMVVEDEDVIRTRRERSQLLKTPKKLVPGKSSEKKVATQQIENGKKLKV